jgi:nitrile hydratase
MIKIDTRFSVGDEVRVLDLNKSGHIRIPVYIRGNVGEIVHYCGKYLNPEDLAIGRTDGPAIDLYRVDFSMGKLWPSDTYQPNDRLVIEIYDHWLAPA